MHPIDNLSFVDIKNPPLINTHLLSPKIRGELISSIVSQYGLTCEYLLYKNKQGVDDLLLLIDGNIYHHDNNGFWSRAYFDVSSLIYREITAKGIYFK